jgi:hypothetical protein
MINIKKPIKVSGSKKRPRPTRFYALVFSVILVFGLFNGFLVKNAFAYEDNYINDTAYYRDATTGDLIFRFHVKTSFQIEDGTYCHSFDYCGIYGWWLYNGAIVLNSNPPITSIDYIFQAGTTYYFDLGQICNPRQGDAINTDYYGMFAKIIPAYSYIDLAYFTETPTMTITFPHNNDELTGAFNIQGSYTMPANAFNKLYVGFEPTLSGFYQDITGTSGNVLIPVNSLPAGDYTLKFYFYLTGEFFNAYEVPLSIDIKIVNDIPPALPTGETPPEVPIYPPTAPDTYHADYCAYGTSTTPLFNTLTGAVSGMITSIGDNLATFAGRFSNTDAKDTGEQLASSVLIMRSYVAGLNSFFGELPVGEILILYLIVFVLVILFRVIKGLINLIKP